MPQGLESRHCPTRAACSSQVPTYHSRGGVHDAHMLQNSRAIVGDDGLARRGDDHLVHAPRTERSTDTVRDGCRGVNVAVQAEGVLECQQSSLLNASELAACKFRSAHRDWSKNAYLWQPSLLHGQIWISIRLCSHCAALYPISLPLTVG